MICIENDVFSGPPENASSPTILQIEENLSLYFIDKD